MASFVESQGHAGDEGNFEALYSTYRSEVQRLASYLLRNAADAEDASQTVFVNVLRALRQGVQPADPRAWLLAITRNVCFSRHRAAGARPDEVELDPERLPEPQGDDTPSVDEIVGALARMLPNQRTALILRDFRGAPHTEICELLTLSPAGAETLLSRARVSFREEIDAGEQPFDCAETKALVEQQLAGSITTAERHSLRTHLRHCSPCSTLARAVRSSRGKLAGLLFWPSELLSRLASALSQAPAAAHVAAAVTSTAAIATVAIPAAVVHAPAADHVDSHTARAPALAAASTGATATPARAANSAVNAFRSHAGVMGSITHGRARVHGRTPHALSSKAHAARSTHVKAQAAAQASPATSNAATNGHPTAAPIVSSPRQGSPPAATTPVVKQPVAVPPHSSSPAVRPSAKSKPKPAARHAPRRKSGGRHPTDPADVMPGSQPPASSLPAPATGGTGVELGAGGSSSTASTPSKSTSDSISKSSSAGTSGNATNTGSNNGSGDGGSGNHHKPKR